jgi:hypothetical protein
MAEHETDSAQETALEEITDAELYDAFIAAAQSDLHTCCPCTVTEVNGRTVTVTPGVNRYVPDGAGNLISEPLPQLKDVPIADMVANGMIIALPVTVGDTGVLIFSERPIGAWRATGQQGDPGDVGMHTLDGAIFVPMLQPDAKTAQSADATGIVIGSDSNPAGRLVIRPAMILAGATASNFVAMSDKVLSALNAIVSGFNTHIHPAGTPNTGQPTAPLSAPGSVASSNLKAND